MEDAQDGQIEADKPETKPFVPTFVEKSEPELTAKAKLRAFEDKVLGPDAVRISGQIEKGHGSHFKTKMTEKQRRHHAALEHLVEAEEKLAQVGASLAAAEAHHEAAKVKVAAVESKSDGSEQPE